MLEFLIRTGFFVAWVQKWTGIGYGLMMWQRREVEGGPTMPKQRHSKDVHDTGCSCEYE